MCERWSGGAFSWKMIYFFYCTKFCCFCVLHFRNFSCYARQNREKKKWMLTATVFGRAESQICHRKRWQQQILSEANDESAEKIPNFVIFFKLRTDILCSLRLAYNDIRPNKTNELRGNKKNFEENIYIYKLFFLIPIGHCSFFFCKVCVVYGVCYSFVGYFFFSLVHLFAVRGPHENFVQQQQKL